MILRRLFAINLMMIVMMMLMMMTTMMIKTIFVNGASFNAELRSNVHFIQLYLVYYRVFRLELDLSWTCAKVTKPLFFSPYERKPSPLEPTKRLPIDVEFSEVSSVSDYRDVTKY